MQFDAICHHNTIRLSRYFMCSVTRARRYCGMAWELCPLFVDVLISQLQHVNINVKICVPVLWIIDNSKNDNNKKIQWHQIDGAGIQLTAS